jgi:D-threo-aldose 1-dehydrogenase
LSGASTTASTLPTAAIGPRQLRVTRLGMGTVPLGGMLGHVDESDANAVVAQAFAVGVRHFDTAPQYGSGLAERRLGSSIRSLPRDEIVISTKVGRLLRRASFGRKVARTVRQSFTPGEGGPRILARNAARVVGRMTGRNHGFPLGYPFDTGERALEPFFDFSYDGVLRSVEASLKRLGVDRVDMLLIHDPDDHHREALDGAYRALDRLRADGSVRAIGVGMNHAAPLARFAREADFDCLLLAGRYTLLDQTGAEELLPLCAERGIPVLIGGVFNSGLLADPRPGISFDYHAVEDGSPWLQRALRMQVICERHGVPLAAAALQFPLAHPAIASVLCGVRSAPEIARDVELFQWPIPSEMWRELQESGELADALPVPDGPVTSR